MAQQRPKGTGSIYFDADRNRWVGSVDAGWTERGTRRRRKLSGKTKSVVQQKIRDAQRTDVVATTGNVSMTVKRWAEQWLETTKSRLRPATWANNRSQIVKWAIPAIGHRRLADLRPADMRAISRAMISGGLSSTSAQRAHVVVVKMLKDAVLEGYTIPQAVFMTGAPVKSETDRDAIPLDDALALLAAGAARPDASRWVAAFLQGMRPAECRGLTWDAINFDDDRIDVTWQAQALPYNIPRDRSSGVRVPDGYEVRHLSGAWHLTRPKTKAGVRPIPLVPWMRAALLAWRDEAPSSPHGLVWPATDGKPRIDKADRAAFVDLQDAARVAHLDGEVGRRYDLYEARHTTATLLKEAGVDDETIVAIMGHASILSTKAYLHTSSARTRKALDAVAERLGLIEAGEQALPA